MLCPTIWFDGIKREKICCFSWDFVPFVNHVHWKNYAFVSDKFICFDFKSLPFFSLLKHFSVWKFSCSSMLQSNLYSIFFFIPSQQCIDLALLIFSGFSPNLESLQKNFRILCAGGFGNFGDIFRQKMTTFIIYFYFTGSWNLLPSKATQFGYENSAQHSVSRSYFPNKISYILYIKFRGRLLDLSLDGLQAGILKKVAHEIPLLLPR